MLNNPTTLSYNNQGNPLQFTFKGGAKAYHFSTMDLPQFKRWVAMNTVFFADSVEHAHEIMMSYLRWGIKQTTILIEKDLAEAESQSNYMYARHVPDYIRKREIFQKLLNCAHLFKYTEVDHNQFIKATWAGNDTWF